MPNFLIAEYCRGPFYMGWHLYIRENRTFRPNKDGRWGWLRDVARDPVGPTLEAVKFLKSIGIEISGDGTCDNDGISEFARRYPIKGRKCGGKLRGCLEIEIDQYGTITAANGHIVNDLQ